MRQDSASGASCRATKDKYYVSVEIMLYLHLITAWFILHITMASHLGGLQHYCKWGPISWMHHKKPLELSLNASAFPAVTEAWQELDIGSVWPHSYCFIIVVIETVTCVGWQVVNDCTNESLSYVQCYCSRMFSNYPPVQVACSPVLDWLRACVVYTTISTTWYWYRRHADNHTDVK